MPTNEQIELARMAFWTQAYMATAADKSIDAGTSASYADEGLKEFDKRFPYDKSIEAKAERGMRDMGFTPSPSPKEFYIGLNWDKTAAVVYRENPGYEGIIHVREVTANSNPCIWKDPRKELPEASKRKCITVMANGDIHIVDALLIIQAPNGFNFWSYHPKPSKE